MGEGHVKEPAKVKELTLKTVAKHRARNEYELAQVRLWFNDLKAKYKLVVDDYNTFLARYSKNINGNMKDLYNGINTELATVNFELDLIGAAGSLARISQNATQKTALMEREQHMQTAL